VIVRSVEAIPLSYPEPNDSGATRHICVVKVTTDDGVVGWGESITQWPEATRATVEIVRGLAELVIGQDVRHVERIWQSMSKHVWWYGWRGGIASNAISAIDIALWDAKGRTLDTSVLDLLGGPVHDRLPALASAHAFKPDIGDLVADMGSWVADGFQGVKVGFGKKGDARLGYEHDRDVEFVRRLREAIGPSADLMVDLGVAVYWDPSTAIRRVRAFEEHGLTWIEEPLGPWNPDGYARLRGAVTTLLAWGEREWDARGIDEVLDTGCVDVVGVDPGRVAGLTGFRQIAGRIEARGHQLNAHAWSSAIGTAASLAGSFASTAARRFELKPLANPMQHELVADPFGHVDGWVLPPTGPGLGIVVDEAVLKRYRADRD
jgi:L-alanine-DL-glutamate epimerase-like enolase superfamily enzyme